MERMEKILSKSTEKKEKEMEKICKHVIGRLKKEAIMSRTESEQKLVSEMLAPFESTCLEDVDNFMMRREYMDVKKILSEPEYKEKLRHYHESMERGSFPTPRKLEGKGKRFLRKALKRLGL